MKTIKTTKMQGLGNDFVVLDYEEYEKTGMTMPELAKKICDRNFGIGADGMMIPNLSPKDEAADIGWYFYNSDGSIAQMCGNGIRCFTKYVYDKKLVKTKKFSVETLAGIIIPELQENGEVKVNMNKPILKAEKIPFLLSEDVILNSFQDLKNERLCDDKTSSARLAFGIEVQVLDKTFKINAVSMGNPHCVIFCEPTDNLLELAKTYGPELEKHELFPEKTNVEFVKVINKNEMDFCVYERGCGITLACGTGACASVVAGILNNLTENKVKVNLLGGALTIEWQGSSQDLNHDVFMSGPAEYSFFAEYIL